MGKAWLAPLTGVAFVALVIIGGAVQGEPPGADAPAQELVSHYADNSDSIWVGALLISLGLASFIFFAGYLRRVLRGNEARPAALPSVVLAGATVLAVGGAIDSTISIALAEAAEDIDPVAVQALQALWDNDFLPLALGASVFLLAAGLSIIGSRALPAWLGWIAVALAIIGFTPVGFIAFLGAGIWILIVSVMLMLRERQETRPAPAQPPGPAG
jgi:hypothetical protein